MQKLLIILIFLLMAQDRAREAYRAYNEQNYTAAVEGFRDALEADPTNPRLWFNLGNALAMKGDIEEARRAWQRFQAIEENQTERSKSDYNLGTSLARNEQYEDALKALREALRKTPDDEDMRFNFEWAQRQLQQQQEEQQQQQQEEQSESMEMPFELNGDQQDGEQESQPADGQQVEEGSDDAPPAPPQPQEGELSQEDADNMLNALDNIEQDLIRDFQQRQIDQTERNEKDW